MAGEKEGMRETEKFEYLANEQKKKVFRWNK